jgi:transposase
MPTTATSFPWCLWRALPLCSVRFSRRPYTRKAVERQLKTVPQQGHVRQVKYCLAILAVVDGQSCAAVAVIRRVHEKTVAAWGRGFCCAGLQGAPHQKPTGRPPTLTPTPHAARATRSAAGPLQAGFRGACWRSPMIQQRMYERCGVFSTVVSSAQVLQHLGVR